MPATISIRLAEPLKERVQNLADTRKTSPHSVMVQAIERFIEHEEKREALRQAGIAAHNQYIQTGLHVTNAEAREWFKSLAAGNDVEPPKCHI